MAAGSRVAMIVCAAAAALGLYAWIGTVWWPGYLEALRLHIVFGLIVLLVSVPVVAGHVASTGAPIGRTLLLPAVAFAALAALCPGRPEYPAFGPIGWAGATASAQLVLTAAVAGLLRRARPPADPAAETREVGSLSGALLATALLYLLHVGLFGWLLRGDERWGAMFTHSAIGVGTAVLLLGHVPGVRRRLGKARVPALAALLGLAAWHWATSYPHDLIFGDFRSPLGFDAGLQPLTQTPDEAARFAFVPSSAAAMRQEGRTLLDPDLVGDSARCGEAGCHEVLTRTWSGSVHRFATDNDLFGRVVRLLVEEQGPDAAVFCAACHDPVRALAGTVSTAYADGGPPPGDGVSCVVCHGTVDVGSPPANGNLLVREPRRYPGATAARRNALIRLDPRAHRQDMVGNFRMAEGDLGCAACHRLEIGPEMGSALAAAVPLPYKPPPPGQRHAGLGCNDCHMPTLTIKRPFEQPIYDHYWSGTAFDLPVYAQAGLDDRAALQEVAEHAFAFVAGQLDVAPLDPELQYARAASTVREMRESGLLSVQVSPRRTAAGLAVGIRTTKHRAGHPFPTGSLDFKDVWQEVRVVDSAGAILAHVGALDGRGHVDPRAFRLGARYLDKEGADLRHHRVWELGAVEDVVQVPALGWIDNEVSIALAEPAPGPLTVSVRWRYRRANQAFTDWIYDGDGTTFPIHDLATASVQVP